MILVKTVKELEQKLNIFRKLGSVGFVPTMGALHAGHLSLVEKAAGENKTVVVSIFVNPTQFNDSGDLERYPRNLEADMQLLEPSGCQLVFAPAVHEVYPEPDTRKFDFGLLETTMEGKFRPGHFNGVAQVVSRLFDMVKPDNAYFGMKDFQQLAIIQAMTKQLGLPVHIVACPIVREKSGLAMSSRNELLSAEERENAPAIFRILTEAKKLTGQKSVQELTRWIAENINKNRFLSVEYVEIVNNENLQPVLSWSEKNIKVVCVAVFCGKVRLIDNMVLN